MRPLYSDVLVQEILCLTNPDIFFCRYVWRYNRQVSPAVNGYREISAMNKPLRGEGIEDFGDERQSCR